MDETIEITLNGERRRVPPCWTIDDLVGDLGLASQAVAVEVNLEIVNRRHWSKRRVSEADAVEIVHFIGGGESEHHAG